MLCRISSLAVFLAASAAVSAAPSGFPQAHFAPSPVSSSPSLKNIAIFLTTTRPIRTSPAVGSFLTSHLTPFLPPPSSSSSSNITFSTLDLASYRLPHFASSFSPRGLDPLSPHLGQDVPIVSNFSLAVQHFDAFFFVVSEYNAGFNGELKNALDHLFHEWAGKPAVVVSYSSGGGLRAGDALRKILVDGFRMSVVDTVGLPVAWQIDGRVKVGEGSLVEGQEERWVEQGFGRRLEKALEELVAMLQG